MSGTTERIDQYMLDDEEVAFAFSVRPTGLLNWLRSLLGYGRIYWHVTDRRLLLYRPVAGGFDFREVPLDHVTSVRYGRQLDLWLVAIGILTLPILVGVLILLYAFFSRPQALEVDVEGGPGVSVTMSRGEQVDEFLWYVASQRELHRLRRQ